MPNWCHNRITIFGNEESEAKLKEIEETFRKAQPFNEIFPVPDFKTIPNEEGVLPVLKQEFNKDGKLMWETYNFPDGTNDDRWYMWCVNNWGTKWDAGDVDIEYQDSEILELEFDTASNDFNISSAGWETVTTKSRLNAILEEFCDGARVVQRDFEWFLSDFGTLKPFVDGMKV